MAETVLNGRAALVTGANSGIGRATALALGAAGARVMVNYFDDPEAAEEVVEAIRSAGSEAVAHQADVGDEDAVQEMVARAIEAFGTLDILVNNAGIQMDADFIEMSADDWDAVIGTNLRGAFLCSREAARHFCRRDRDRSDDNDSSQNGAIIFISSVHDAIPWAGHANYAASKGGISMLMKSLAQELGPDQVRVNAIAPGAVMTDINREAWESGEERRELLGKIPQGRIGTPEDVAKAVVWLASDDSGYVHGHTLYIDGGMMLYPGFREGG
jgi:glucose 1-dehydrogenase